MKKTILIVVFGLQIFTWSVGRLAGQDKRVKYLHSPASETGFIGGEAHAYYSILARRGQKVRIRLRSLRPGETNGAQFSISFGKSLRGSKSIDFGKISADGKTLTGRIPKTGRYFLDITAYPDTHYRLSITLN